MAKISTLPEKELKNLIIEKFNEYHRDIDRPIDEKTKIHTCKKIYEFLESKSNYAEIGIIEDIFNVALFEKNYTMSFEKFIQRFKELNTQEKKKNEN